MKELRKGEKEGSLDDGDDEQLDLKGRSDQTKENSNIHNSLNSLDSRKKEEGPRKEGGVATSKESLIETTSGDSRGDSSSNEVNEVECSTHREQQEKKVNQNTTKRGDINLLANFKERTGASSPSPSIG